MLLLAQIAFAAPAMAGCSVATTSVAFGTYSPASGSPLDGVGSVTTNCDNKVAGQDVTVTIDGGGSGNEAARRMTAGAGILNYQLYSDATRLIVWGQGSSGVTYRGRSRIVTTTIYGRIPAGQNVPAGSYSDALIVTVIF